MGVSPTKADVVTRPRSDVTTISGRYWEDDLPKVVTRPRSDVTTIKANVVYKYAYPVVTRPRSDVTTIYEPFMREDVRWL